MISDGHGMRKIYGYGKLLERLDGENSMEGPREVNLGAGPISALDTTKSDALGRRPSTRIMQDKSLSNS